MRLRCYCIVLLVIAMLSQASAQMSPKTLQDIQLLVNEKNSRSPEQKKIDSRLLQFIRERRGQKMVEGLTLEAAKVNADTKGNFKADIQAEVDDNLVSRIEALGGKIIFSSTEFHSINAEINSTIVEKIAALPEIRFIEPAAIPTLEGKPGNKLATFKKDVSVPLTVKKASFENRAKRVKDLINGYLTGKTAARSKFYAGSINSQGDRTHRADDTRNAYGYAGQGIRIGVLSDSYNALGAAAADVASGNLPGPGNPFGNTTPVTVLQDITGASDEGRAMVQIVHDLAPKAQLFFATAFVSPASFASNIIALRNAPYNCDIIIDDVSWSDEPVFYDGIIAQAVNTVTANGAMYFSSAGNSGSLVKNTSGAYEADFNDVGSPVFTGGTKTGTIHNFGTVLSPVNGDSIILVSGSYSLFWADPVAASTNDYDLFVVSATGVVKAFSTNIQSGTQNPFEYIQTPPTLVAGDRLVVFKAAAAAPRAFHINTGRGRLKFATAGQTHGHGSAAAAYSVAAAPAAGAFTTGAPTGPYPNAYSATNQVETFSSDGPRRIFFNANGTPVTPNNYLFGTNGGVVRNKPDITAADGVATTLPAASGLNPFYGTSAAAPHAGAIAGLIKSANPSLTTAQIRTILTTTTIDIEGAGYDNVSGYGILQAFQAMQLLSPTPMATITLGTSNTSEGSFNNGNGRVDPGEIGNLNIQLNNPSMVNATSVSAILSTSTPGVTVVQNTSEYGTVNAGGNGLNQTPFSIAVNPNIACGSVINFSLLVSFSGGLSPQTFVLSTTIGSQPFTGITATLSGTPPVGMGYTSLSGQQTGRIFRGSLASSCSTPVANPGLTITTGARQYDAYTFTNSNIASQCVTVTMTSTNGINLYCAAYSDSGFSPANPSINYIAEPGPSSITQTYSFNVASGKAFTVVVSDINVTPASNSPYTLSVSLSNCSVGPVCSPTNITTETISSGSAGNTYTQSFAATGGSSSYNFSLIGGLPAGLSFNGNTISGTPTQAGSFPIKIAAVDLTGCPPDTNSYTLVVTGFLPASVTTIKGTPQTVFPRTAFPDSLQAIVRDLNNVPLGGVNVIFTAPSSGASGTFTAGVKMVTVVTNAAGIASAPIFTSNDSTGSYSVTASVNGVPDAGFSLTNFCPSSFVVTSNADSGPGTLRDIVSNGCAGVPITFDPSISSIVLTSGEIVITKAATIIGPGASKLVISGNNNSRIFNIASGASAIVSISGLTIRDGKPITGVGGGGILITTSIVNISGCVITNNDVSGISGVGAGIGNEGGVVTIDRSSITNNTTTYRGGGIQNEGTGASMIISNSTIAGNTAGSTGLGGGIRSFLSLNIVNSTIYGNAAQSGGNISRAADSIRFGNTIIAGGTLLGTGGTGPDLSGGGFRSNDYNLIQNLTASGTIVGLTTHNIAGVSPLLLPLSDNGGETPTILPLPNSPAVNAGDSAIAITKDQRNFNRVINNRTDIGAVETNYSLTTTSGTPQTTEILRPFSRVLQALVTESSNNTGGVSVIFSAPATGASGTFPNGFRKDTAVTNSSGIANSRVFTANNTFGMYLDTASIGITLPVATYNLTNAIVLPLVFSGVNASTVNCTTNISWKTQSEIDTKDFTIEYSEDGLSFNDLVTLPAKGSSSSSSQTYTYGHVSTQEGMHYYRIKQRDINGLFSYSSVLAVNSKCGSQPITVYPNPVKNKLTVTIPGTETQVLTVFDALGQKIHQQQVRGGTVEINATSWMKGTYTLTITQKGQSPFVLKLVKE